MNQLIKKVNIFLYKLENEKRKPSFDLEVEIHPVNFI